MLKAAAHIDFLFPLRAFAAKVLPSAGFGCQSAGMTVSGKPDEQEGNLFSEITQDGAFSERMLKCLCESQ